MHRNCELDNDNSLHDYIYLWTWNNFDENTHQLVGSEEKIYDRTFTKIAMDKLEIVEAIMFSNPRWGGYLTNRFEFRNSDNDSEIPPFFNIICFKYENSRFLELMI